MTGSMAAARKEGGGYSAICGLKLDVVHGFDVSSLKCAEYVLIVEQMGASCKREY